MSFSIALCALLAIGSTAYSTMTGAAALTIFAPGAIAGTDDDGATAYTPDGVTVYFMRGTDSFTLMESHREMAITDRRQRQRRSPAAGAISIRRCPMVNRSTRFMRASIVPARA